jgi:hypothetical protein
VETETARRRAAQSKARRGKATYELSALLPLELIDGLSHLRAIARLPDLTVDQQHALSRAVGRLVLVGSAAGWSLEAMAEVLDIDLYALRRSREAARLRVRVLSGLAVPAAPSKVRPPGPPAPTPPLEERAWLLSGQAALLMDVTVTTLMVWRLRGLLPSSRKARKGWEYSREDLLMLIRYRVSGPQGRTSYEATRDALLVALRSADEALS